MNLNEEDNGQEDELSDNGQKDDNVQEEEEDAQEEDEAVRSEDEEDNVDNFMEAGGHEPKEDICKWPELREQIKADLEAAHK